jgi:hypothetical protein
MYIKNKKKFLKFIKFPDLKISQISTPNFLTPELTSLTPQVETAIKWSICKISFKNIDKNLNLNSRICRLKKSALRGRFLAISRELFIGAKKFLHF